MNMYRRSTKNFTPNIFMMLVIIAGLIPSTVAAFGFSLEATQKSIEKKYSNINHIDGSHFLKLNTEKTLIFDIRQQNEFDVSHIKKAIRVDPTLPIKILWTSLAFR